MPGPAGPQGLTGPQGLQGFRGLRGLPFGPTGPAYNGLGYLLTIVSPTTSNIVLTEASLYTYYNIASQSTTTVTFPTRSETYPVPEQAGAFWVFRNNFGSTITLNFSNGTVDSTGTVAATTLTIPSGNGTTIAYLSNTTCYIAF